MNGTNQNETGPVTEALFDKMSWLCWLRVIAILSMDVVAEPPVNLELPVLEWGEVRARARIAILKHERLYKWRDYSEPGSSSKPWKRNTFSMVSELFRGLSDQYGRHPSRCLFKWCTILWGDLKDDNWDWFAYRTAISKWAGSYIHRGADVLGLGEAAPHLRARFETLHDANARFDTLKRDLRRRVLSEWDQYCTHLATLSLHEDTPDPWTDLVEVLGRGVGSAGFQLFWADLLKLLTIEDQRRLHARALSLMSQRQMNYPDGRRLPQPWEIRPPCEQ